MRSFVILLHLSFEPYCGPPGGVCTIFLRFHIMWNILPSYFRQRIYSSENFYWGCKSLRRVVYLLLGLSLIVLLPAVVAAQTMTAKEAAELVKERITVPADAEDFTSDYSEYDGRGQWEFRWKGKGETLSATLDAASCDIVNLYAYGDAFEGKATFVPKVSLMEALEAAKRFLQKAAPSRYNSLRFTDQPPRVIPLSHQQDYSFYFERIVNGVPCSFNGAEVRVSQSTGKITNYYLTWDYKSKFPPAGNTISPERGAEIMKDNAFELMYFRPYPEKEGQEREVKLVYGIYEPRRVMVDAVSGKFVKSSYFIYSGCNGC